MAFKSIIGAVSICLAVASFNVSAIPTNSDWLSAGDNLITHDTVSGLDWLDLTETNGLSYDYVSGQLGAGSTYEGWRYATSLEVLGLWSNFGVDLSAGVAGTVYDYIDPGIASATLFIGNIFCEYNCAAYPDGAFGLTADGNGQGGPEVLGAYLSNNLGDNATGTVYAQQSGSRNFQGDSVAVYAGSYLVRDANVPEPSVAILMASGLIAFGVVRRKRRA